MGYKKTNLITILSITVIVLGGMYAYKKYRLTPNVQGQNFQQDINIEGNNKEPNKTTNQIEEIPQNSNLSEEISVLPPTESPSSTAQPEVTPTKTINTKNNKYYYNQLEKYSKAIYDAIEQNIENLKTGNCTINIDYDFSELLNEPNGQTQLNNYYKATINAINLDIPDLFYIDFSKISLNIEQTKTMFGSTYKLYMNSGDNSNFLSDGFYTKSQVEETTNKLESIKKQLISTSSGSNYNKMLQIHDWIINNMSYDGTSANKATIYGALIEKKGVCEAYARTFKYLLDELKIENILAVGVGTNSNGASEDHMWNYVKLNNKWYAVDTTWDDPIVYGGGKVDYQTAHKYFLIGSTELFKNHIEKSEISDDGKTFKFPELSETNYK